MKNNNLLPIKGEDCPVYKYSVSDIYKIKKSILFWKLVDILAFKLKKIAKIYEKSISKEYIRETKMFDISDAENILHIGCGAYPITAMTLHGLNGGKIVGIDRSETAVNMARKVILDRNMQDRITIERGDGANYPIRDFDTIIVSSCSIPKNQILNHLFRTAKPNSKIIVREQNGASKLVDHYLSLRNDIEIVKKIGNHPFPTSYWNSYYVIKK